MLSPVSPTGLAVGLGYMSCPGAWAFGSVWGWGWGSSLSAAAFLPRIPSFSEHFLDLCHVGV